MISEVIENIHELIKKNNTVLDITKEYYKEDSAIPKIIEEIFDRNPTYDISIYYDNIGDPVIKILYTKYDYSTNNPTYTRENLREIAIAWKKTQSEIDLFILDNFIKDIKKQILKAAGMGIIEKSFLIKNPDDFHYMKQRLLETFPDIYIKLLTFSNMNEPRYFIDLYWGRMTNA